MKQRFIQNKTDRDKAFSDIIEKVSFPYVLSVSREKQRSESQNSRYWVTLEDWLVEIAKYITAASDHTGYTPYEIRKLVAAEMPWPQSSLLATLTKEPAHEIMKSICGIPTSTKLGTKEFSKFDTIMESTMADILGSIKAITGRMM